MLPRLFNRRELLTVLVLAMYAGAEEGAGGGEAL